jgi:hypothetical protein
MSTSDFTPAEDETLISRLVDEEATDDEKTRLVELLESEAPTRSTYIEHVCFDTLLRETLGSDNLRGLVDSVTDTAIQTASAPAATASTPIRKRTVTRRTTILRIVAGLTSIAAVLFVGVGLLILPAIKSPRMPESSTMPTRRVRSENNLEQIGVALHKHHDAFETLPSAYNTDPQGGPLLSWRVHLLPYLDQQELYEKFHLDEPWDSEHNQTLISLIPNVYRLPGENLEEGHTCYLAIRHENSALSPPTPNSFGTIPPSGISMNQVTDGKVQTIAVVEVNADRAAVWSRPDDYRLDADAPMSGIGKNWPGGFLALFLDGIVRMLPGDIDREVFLSYSTRSGGEPPIDP